jgi:hypothetical protein
MILISTCSCTPVTRILVVKNLKDPKVHDKFRYRTVTVTMIIMTTLLVMMMMMMIMK